MVGVLPKDYGIFERVVLEDLMRLFNSDRIKQANGDVFGRMYEYFLAKFSIQKAHDSGEFFTPSSIVQTIVNVIEPDHGIVFDPACGSGGMFVQSSHFIEQEGGDTAQKVVFYGQEKNPDTIRIAQMNLAVHGLEGKIADAITYYQDEHNLLGGCDFVMAIRAGFDDNLTDYLHEHSIAHAFHHNAFLVVSNGDEARYGSITSKWDHFAEWKRNTEKDKARLDAEALLDGMLAKDRLLDIVENFVLFDDSRAGGTRKIVARNHQVLGVNNAVASVTRQEELKRRYPADERIIEYEVPMPERMKALEANLSEPGMRLPGRSGQREEQLLLVKRAHVDLGRLGVFWHTQGSGKSYSMAFFTKKVRRVVPGNFTFLVMTDREDLDDQISRTFVGCGVTDEKTPRAASGKELQKILSENHRFVFSLIHKFNQPVTEPYSDRDDIIVVSDEAHRTQAGTCCRCADQRLRTTSHLG